MALTLTLAVVGLLIGPLLGIVVDRAVERERPELDHRCGRCGTSLGRASLIPIRSWFVRCPTDSRHPSWRYPTTDIAAAIMFAVAGFRFGLAWQLWPYLALFAVLAVLFTIDAEHHLLVDVLTKPALAVMTFLVLVLSGPNDFGDGLWPALAGGAFLGGFLLLAHLAYPAGMGLGDVKLAPTLGLALGWLHVSVIESFRSIVYAVLISNLLAGAIGIAMRRWASRQPPERFEHQPDDWIPGEIPLGPFLILGTVVMVAVTEPAALTL